MSSESSDDLPLNARGYSPNLTGSEGGSPVPDWLSAHKVSFDRLPAIEAPPHFVTVPVVHACIAFLPLGLQRGAAHAFHTSETYR